MQYAESTTPPEVCVICSDERQYVGWQGQRWTTMDALADQGYRNEIREEEPGLIGIGMVPTFSIGQRALLVLSEHGNVLYDCISYVDPATVRAVEALGGIHAMTLSHPHFYDSMVSWSQAFGGAPIYIPEADRQWVTRPDPAIRYWDGAPTEIVPGVTLIQCGGHFPGSAVLHCAAGDGGRGALLVGDSITVVMDRRRVSFMHSYPNLLPLPATAVQGIVDAIEPFPFDRIYGGWWQRNILSNAKSAVLDSARRYQELIAPDGV